MSRINQTHKIQPISIEFKHLPATERNKEFQMIITVFLLTRETASVPDYGLESGNNFKKITSLQCKNVLALKRAFQVFYSASSENMLLVAELVYFVTALVFSETVLLYQFQPAAADTTLQTSRKVSFQTLICNKANGKHRCSSRVRVDLLPHVAGSRFFLPFGFPQEPHPCVRVKLLQHDDRLFFPFPSGPPR